MHDSGYILILIPVPGKFKSLIPVPILIPARSPQFDFLDSDSSQKQYNASLTHTLV